MLKKEIRLAFRRLFRDAKYSLVNLVGLTLSVSFSFLIILYVSEETSYDKHIRDSDQVYRIAADFKINDHRDIYSNVPRPIGEALVNEFPDIQVATKITGYNGLQTHSGYLRTSDKLIHSPHLFAADSNFLKVFDCSLIEGDERSLHHPNRILISDSLAKKLFGTESALGKSITLENEMVVEVSGIFKSHKKATFLRYEALISYTTFYPSASSEKWWYGGHVFTYIKTHRNFDPQNIYNQWDSFFKKYMKSTFDQLGGSASIIFQPIQEIHLSPEYIWEPYSHGSKSNIKIFSSIAIFLLLVAGFNYTNLSLSQSFHMKQEILIRKMLGASKFHIIRQHLLTAILLSTFASVMSVSLISTLTPLLIQLIGYPYTINFIESPQLLLLIFSTCLILGLSANIYPAIRNSLVKNESNLAEPKIITRKILVFGQFTIAITLIICTLVVIDQILHVRNIDVGYNKENLILIRTKDAEIKKNIDAFKESLKSLAHVKDVSLVNETPRGGPNEFTYSIKNSKGESISISSQTIAVGQDFLNTVGLELLAGRGFEKKDDGYKGLIINSFIASKMGYEPSEAIGTKVKFNNGERTIIGVVNDFQWGSAQDPKQAMTIGYRNGSKQYLLIRLDPENQQRTLEQIEDLWASLGSTLPFNYTFIEDEFEYLLAKENQLYTLLIIGSILIIIISGLGLIGLVAHKTDQRTKEIGVRKILGAMPKQLYFLLLREFLIIYIISFCIGSFGAWRLSTEWLNDYHYRTNFEWLNICIAAALGFTILLTTVSFHLIQLVRSNPVNSLRNE